MCGPLSIQPTLSFGTFVSSPSLLHMINDLSRIILFLSLDNSVQSPRPPLPQINFSFCKFSTVVSVSSRTMSQSCLLIVYHRVCHLFWQGFRSWEKVYSRVVGKRRFQMLGQPFEIVTELLELAVGHRRELGELGWAWVLETGVGPEGGRDGPEERELLVDPPGNTRTGMRKMSLTSPSTSPQRKRDATPIDSCVGNVARLLARAGADEVVGGGFRPERKEKETGEVLL